MNLTKNEQINYIKSYKNFIKNIKVNVKALKRSENRFLLS